MSNFCLNLIQQSNPFISLVSCFKYYSFIEKPGGPPNLHVWMLWGGGPNAYGRSGTSSPPPPIRTPITRANYTWKKKPYVYYMFGNELKVNADDYPATGC